MDTVQMVRERLSGRTWTQLKEIEAATGVPAHTIRHIQLGNTLNPGYNTVEPLRVYLDRERTTS